MGLFCIVNVKPGCRIEITFAQCLWTSRPLSQGTWVCIEFANVRQNFKKAFASPKICKFCRWLRGCTAFFIIYWALCPWMCSHTWGFDCKGRGKENIFCNCPKGHFLNLSYLYIGRYLLTLTTGSQFRSFFTQIPPLVSLAKKQQS